VSLVITKPNIAWPDTRELTRVMIDGLLFGLIAD
jgi:hypothetical protein